MLRMVVIQSTPYCNIDCKYCYLPNRNRKGIIGDDILTLILSRVAASPFLSDELEILWHCGEPLVAGIDFYEQALRKQSSIFNGRVRISNTIQTNATLLTPEWCEFLLRNNFAIGVSLDGPAFIHDHSRTFRNGRGTFDRAMRGSKLLQEAGVRFGCLSVLTSFSIRHPKELLEFYASNGFSWVGFNLEEQEGVHGPSSLEGMHTLYRRFLDEFIELWDGAGRPFVLREVADMIGVMDDIRRHSRMEDACRKPDETVPFRIVSFDLDGNFSTFSPELLSTRAGGRYKDFFLGNVRTHEISTALLDENEFVGDVLAGVDRCREGCGYFPVCGGGFISNRWAENQNFASQETNACKLHRQVLAESVLSWLEQK